MKFKDFLRVIKGIRPLDRLSESDWQRLQLLLAKKDKKQAEAEEGMIEEVLRRVESNTPHLQFRISVPSELDREHVQAILVYGFAPPTQRQMFAGRRPINEVTHRRFVQNKLMDGFDLASFNKALRWLIRNGVLTEANGLALNVSMKKCTAQGRELVQKVLEFSRKA